MATLLLHGAHAHRPDKHGITPEMLARQNGQLECADILCQWELNKDSDLKEREAILGEQPPRSISNPSDTFETLSRKRIHVKRSIDNAFSLFRSDSHLKSSTSASPPPSLRNHTDQPSYASKPLGDYTFYPVDSDPTSDVSERRPSLPHLHMNVFKVSPTSRAPPSPRRPRSAGTDSEPPAPPSNHPRKLGTKYSLLHLFRKAHPTGDVLTSTSHSSITPDPLHPAISPSSPGYTSTLPIPTHRSTSDSQALSSSPNAAHSSSSLGPSSNHYGIHGADTSVHRTDLTSSVDVHRATPHRQQPYPRGPLASGFNTPGGVYQSEVAVVRRSETSLTTDGFLPRRSSPHGLKGLRFDSTSSRGGGIRLRDDSSTARSSAMAGPKGRSSSVSSARSDGGRGVRSSTQVPESAPAGTSDFRGVHPDADGGEDEEEYGIPIERSHFSQGLREFGSPRLAELRTEGHRSVASSTSSFEQHGMLAPDVGLDVQPDGNVSSAPPRVPEYPFSIDRPPSSDVDGRSKHLVVHPPPLSPSPSPSPAPAPVPTPANVPPLMEGVDNRGRGDSISSVSTNGSQPLSSSGTTATSSSSITTPGIASLGVTYPMGHGRKWDVDGSMFLSKEEGLTNPAIADAVDEFGALGHIGGGGTAALTNDRNVSIGERRSHTPLDINIRSISSHAQAEALVERAQRSILEMKDYEMPLHYHLDDDDQTPLSAGLITAGWTPLSAKLAAYGESLAIERKLKQEEEARRGSGCDEIRDGGISVGEEEAGNGEGGEDRAERVEHVENTVAKNASKSRKAGLDRQFSLEQKTSAGSHSRVVVPRRPNTSSGTTTDGCEHFFSVSRPSKVYFANRFVQSIRPRRTPITITDVHGLGRQPWGQLTPQVTIVTPANSGRRRSLR